MSNMIKHTDFPIGIDIEENQFVVVRLAELAHSGQFRSNGDPYITHPRRIADKVFANTRNYSMWAAALLHDTVEDSEGRVTLQMISEQVSPFVAEMVDHLTHREGEEYFDYVRRCISHPYAKHIKRTDILDNLTDVSFTVGRFKKYIKALEMMAE